MTKEERKKLGMETLKKLEKILDLTRFSPEEFEDKALEIADTLLVAQEKAGSDLFVEARSLYVTYLDNILRGHGIKEEVRRPVLDLIAKAQDAFEIAHILKAKADKICFSETAVQVQATFYRKLRDKNKPEV